jgi:proteasome assembly chaperone (PAC2) family protein
MVWIKHYKNKIRTPTAIVGSPGLRSIGNIAIEFLVKELKPKLIAELFSQYFPIIHGTKPSYLPHSEYPGQAGIYLDKGVAKLPRIEFYLLKSPPLLITKGYNAGFMGQYEIANNVLDLFEEFDTKRMIVLAGYGMEGKEVSCSATDLKTVEELKKNGIEIGYEGPFFGFSGLVFGLGTLRRINGISLFGRTKPIPEEPEYPDKNAAKAILEKVNTLLNLKLDLSKI